MYLRLLQYTSLSSKDLKKKKQYIQASWIGLEGDALKIVSLGFFVWAHFTIVIVLFTNIGTE